MPAPVSPKPARDAVPPSLLKSVLTYTFCSWKAEAFSFHAEAG
jgi:hypothetical protein